MTTGGVAALTEEIDALRAEVARLKAIVEAMAEAGDLGAAYRLTRSEGVVLAMISRAAGLAAKETIWAALYGADPNGGPASGNKILDAFVFRVRRKLKPHGVSIETVWGEGWAMSPADKARLAALSVSGAASGAAAGDQESAG